MDVSPMDKALEEAQFAARRPDTDRLNGRLGAESENAALRLMTEAGLTFADAYRLLSGVYWAGWAQGYTTGRTTAGKES